MSLAQLNWLNDRRLCSEVPCYRRAGPPCPSHVSPRTRALAEMALINDAESTRVPFFHAGPAQRAPSVPFSRCRWPQGRCCRHFGSGESISTAPPSCCCTRRRVRQAGTRRVVTAWWSTRDCKFDSGKYHERGRGERKRFLQ